MTRHMSGICIGLLLPVTAWAQTTLPAESTRPALEFPHLPSRMHAFVWRNWECYPAERLAAVIGASPEQVREVGRSMGLPDWPVMNAEQQRRNYISVIRRNWHLLNYAQLLRLLGWTPEQLGHTLREDDFLWHKLGGFKPACAPIRYEEPGPAVQVRCAEIRKVVEAAVAGLPRPVPRFSFLEELARPLPSDARTGSIKTEGERPLRYLYSYAAVYGDPLLNPDLDPYPEGLLQRLADVGVNGVWLHVVLRDLAPSDDFPEFGHGHETRLANLRAMVQRAKRYGVRIYLYMNEPRAMPEAFFDRRPQMKGVKEGEFVTMCTSEPLVREWISNALAYVFEEVPDLGGVFTISASENLTNCCSHFQQKGCPRCSQRTLPEVIAEVNAAISEGVRRGSPRARVIAWDWGWPNQQAPEIIQRLSSGIDVMSVSEWDQPFTRGGVESKVEEYSISVVGPGPRATRHWGLARARGLRILAKMQVNCTWEISAIPWLPVLDRVAEHCARLRERKIDGQMLSWTLGGYPSPTLRLVQQIFDHPAMTAQEALAAVARERYGDTAVLEAWTAFSRAFAEYPYNGALLYNGPQQVGPANLLFARPTGLASTMVGFPYDDLNGWRGPFPIDVLASQFEKVVAGWDQGLALLRQMASQPRSEQARTHLQQDLGLARAARIHFAATANQIRFNIARGECLSPQASPGQKAASRQRMRELLARERGLAREMIELTGRDSRIGFEATNHYYYLPTDLLEKIVCCEWLAQDR